MVETLQTHVPQIFIGGGGGEETIQTVKNIRVFNNVKGKWGWVGVANTSKQQNTQMETL